MDIIRGDDLILKSVSQDERQAIYRKYIGEEKINELKEEISWKNIPGTSRKLVNTTKISTLLDEISESLPNEIKEAEIVIRQKSAILDQAEEESKKIMNF